MEREKLQSARVWIEAELERCVDFWLKNGMDKVNGGVYTCLDRKGEIYSTDKSVWMQGRCGEVLPGLYGSVLHQPQRCGTHVLHRHR